MIKLISWIGTLSSIIGAFLVASQIIFIGYIFFLVGSASWLVVGVRKNDHSLMTLNLVFFLANVLGIHNAI